MIVGYAEAQREATGFGLPSNANDRHFDGDEGYCERFNRL
jgi:hypothetical protein